MRLLARQEHSDILKDVEPQLSENWEQDAYATAREQLAADAFVEPDPVFSLVAHGSVKDERCGTFMRRKTKVVIGCLNVAGHKGVVGLDGFDYTNKGFFKRVFHSCNRPECPSCGISGWAVRSSKFAEARLRYIAEKFGYEEIYHIIVSFPKNSSLSYAEKKKYAVAYMRSVGIVGGMWCYHHFRYHGKNESYFGEPARYLKGNPHFHVVGFLKNGYGCRGCNNYLGNSEIIDRDRCLACNGFEGKTRRAYDHMVEHGKDALIIKVKDKRNTVGGTIWYELSHASLRKDVKRHVVVNYFGCCARNKVKVPKFKLDFERCCCPLCKLPLQKVVFLGDYKDLLAFMAVKDERNKGLWLDLKDKDGNWLWRTVLEVHEGG